MRESYDCSRHAREQAGRPYAGAEPSLEHSVYVIFSVDIQNMTKTKLYICKDYHIQPSELMRLPYYEYEEMLESIREIQKQEEEERKRQEKSQPSYGDMNPAKMMESMRPQMPSMPTVSIPGL